MEIPAGSRGTYRLAQLDDYASLRRSRFPHAPPWTLSLRARVSAAGLPGTWGFGLWNDPFGLSLGFGGQAGRLPALPNAAWFFHASPPNWLSFRDGVPGSGFFCGVMRSPRFPTLALAPALAVVPLAAVRPVSRLLRRLAGALIRQDGATVGLDVTQWHTYTLDWLHETMVFEANDREILRTRFTPHPPLGLVIWIDNHNAAWRPDGGLGYGTLENPAAWLEIELDRPPRPTARRPG
jgi:hypothetical protein